MLLPYNVDRPARRFPYFTYGLIGINTFVFLVTVFIANVNLPTDRIVAKRESDELLASNRTRLHAQMRQSIRALRRRGYDVPDPQDVPDERLDEYVATRMDEETRRSLAAQLAYYEANDNVGFSRFWRIEHGADTYVMEPHYSVLNVFAYRASEPSGWLKLIGLLGSMFLHGNLEHLLGNMLFLWVFGRALEDALGPRVYMGAYVLCGVIATLLYHVITMQFTPQSAGIPLMGASGAIAGVQGLFSIRFYRTPVRVFVLPLLLALVLLIPLGYSSMGSAGVTFGFMLGVSPLLFLGRKWLWNTFQCPSAWALGAWLVFMDIYPAVKDLVETEQVGGVAHWAHIGGFVFGMLYAGVSGSQEEGIKEFMLEDARKAFASGDMARAASHSRSILRREPNNAAAYEVLAQALERQQQFDDALDTYELAILKYLQSGERDHATRTYIEILPRHPGFIMPPATQVALGNHMARSRDYLNAATTLVKIPYTFPNAPEGEISLLRSAQLYLEHLDQPQTALQLLQTFMERYPHSPLMPQAQRGWDSAARQFEATAGFPSPPAPL